MILIPKAQHGFLFVAYFGDILWRLSHGFKYIYRRWQINIFKISNRVRINPWVFHLGHVLHHFGLKLGVYRPRLNHGQPVEGAHAGRCEGPLNVCTVVTWGQRKVGNLPDIELHQLHSHTLTEPFHGKL